MSYIDRLEILTYQSPKRKTFDLEFEDLARSIARKNAINEFPYQDKANVQDLGMGNLKIPIRCYVKGQDYDLEADRFFKALNEQGYGILDHPRWGSINVLPISITQSESFVENMGRAIFDIEFVEYFPDATSFPEVIYDFISNVLGIVQGVIDIVFQLIDSVITIETQLRRAARNIRRIVGSTISETLRIQSRISGIKDKWKNDTRNNFVSNNFADKFGLNGRKNQDAFNKSIRALEEYISSNPNFTPQEAVSQLLNIFRLPQNEDISGVKVQKSYLDTIDFIESQFENTGTITDFEANVNGYIAIGCIVSMCEKSVTNNVFSRNDILLLNENIYNTSQKLKTIIDKVKSKNGNLDFDVINNTYKILESTQRYLLNLSLQLPTEKKVFLTKDTTPIEFVYSIDGSIDRLDELMQYNNLQSNNILVIPKNTEVRYY